MNTTPNNPSPARVVLFGGSSVRTSYLPIAAQHHVVLGGLLREAYPGQAVTVENRADNGEFIARYLLRGTYERHRADLPGIDVAIIRFGTNDQKRMDVDEYRRQFEKFLALLEQDFPGLHLILETGIYVDYPEHYNFDRNLELDPYWQVSRDLAQERNLPLVDYYAACKREAERGNWDIRVRRGLVIDSAQDAGKEGSADWFTDIHPNPRGTRLAAAEEARVLRAAFPRLLPVGQTTATREPENTAFYERYLDFPSDRLVVPSKPTPCDALQESVGT
jgi:acyl-CoA thioesterase-1